MSRIDNYENESNKVSLPFFGLPKIYPYIKHYKKKVIFLVSFLLVTCIVDLILPLFIKYAIDEYFTLGKLTGIGRYALLYITAAVIQTIATVIWLRTSIQAEVNASRDLRRLGFNHLQTLSFSYFNTNAVGYIHSRVISDTGKISILVSWGVVDFVYSAFYFIGAITLMLILDLKMTLLVLCVLPFIILLSVFFQKRLFKTHRRVREINSRITGSINEGITGAKTTKTLAAEDKMSDAFRILTGDMRKASVRTAKYNSAFISLISAFCFVAISLVLWYGGALAMKDALLIGTLSVFTTYAIAMGDHLRNLARVIADLINISVNIERFTRLLETKPDVTDTQEVIEKYGDVFTPKRENWEPLTGDIEFCDVSFRYPDGDEYVLEHFNLKIAAKTKVAIVGETGAGKSTLVNLVCRFFEPTEGKILIDGTDYRFRSQLWLHSNIGYVLQTPHLFSGTVRENLVYGREDATDEEIEKAVRSVSADAVIAKMDKGLQSQVGEGGDMLSTGEKQLLSFARAILADPAIFILDEATSSVDTVTEKLIQQATDTVLFGRTSFIIAHRLSTIRSADIILVVKNGKIVESGTHDELIHLGGSYHGLYMHQFEEESLARAYKKE
ncbi:MAG: ABC transporter ATP-binding protein [Eubacteriales bacterium]